MPLTARLFYPAQRAVSGIGMNLKYKRGQCLNRGDKGCIIVDWLNENVKLYSILTDGTPIPVL